MKLIFNDSLTSETVFNLISRIEQFSEEDNNNEIMIYFTSSGGYLEASDVLIDYINNRCKYRSKIKLIGSGNIESAGCEVMMFCKCKKDLLPSASAMIHLPYISCKEKEVKRWIFNSEYHKNLFKVIDHENEEKLAKICAFNYLNKKQVESLKKGKDIYLNNTEFKELLGIKK